MNPIKRWYLKYLIRIAAEKRTTGDLADSWYGAAVTQLMFRLAGRDLKTGDSISPIDFELAVPMALSLPTAYKWDSPELAREYGPYGQAPTFLKNATGDYTWDSSKQALAELALHAISPAARAEAWIAGLRKKYPNITGAGAWLASLIVAGLIGALITRAFTCPK
jgi:hypothetical protein